MSSPWRDFKLHTLRFVVGGTVVFNPVTRKYERQDGQELLVTCTLKEATGLGPRERAFLEAAGTDLSQFMLQGRYVDPMRRPANLFPGSTSPLTVEGVDGVFTLEPSWPGQIPAVEEALGERIFGTWRKRAPDDAV